MDDERDSILSYILTIDRRLYDYLQLFRMPDWMDLDLTMPQWKVLFLVCGPRRLSTGSVARSLGMTVSTATGVVDRLVAQGMVVRREDTADRRIVLVQATPRGQALVERLLSSGLGHFRDILNRLSVEELREVSHTLEILHRAAMSLGTEPRPGPADEDSAAQQREEARSTL